MTPEDHADVARLAERAALARTALVALIEAVCPGPHRFVKHHDARDPWCKACRYTPDGELIPRRRL